jgi:acetyl esterase/lipase
MSRLRQSLFVVLAIGLLMATMPRADATEPESDPFADGNGAQATIDGEATQNYLADACPARSSVPPPDAVAEYREYREHDQSIGHLLADIYVPDAFNPPPGGYPAMVIVHGGNFVGGCRTAMGGIAHDISNRTDYPFIVVSIDYRLACAPGEFEAEEIDVLCGWKFNDQQEPRAATHDVQHAISWTRDEAGRFGRPFSGEVVAVGSSAGGNLVFEAAGWGPDPGYLPPGGYRTPVGVAGWSGSTQMLNYQDGQYAGVNVCKARLITQQNEDAYMQCIHSHTKYLGCPYNPDTPATLCMLAQPGGTAYNASPYWQYFHRDTALLPPAFIANATLEVQFLPQAEEFDTLLTNREIVHELCKVGGDYRRAHAAEYIRPDDDVENPPECQTGGHPLTRTLAFLYARLSA